MSSCLLTINSVLITLHTQKVETMNHFTDFNNFVQFGIIYIIYIYNLYTVTVHLFTVTDYVFACLFVCILIFSGR